MYSDSQIRKILKNYGEDCGPITATTRNVYINRIKMLEAKEHRPNSQFNSLGSTNFRERSRSNNDYESNSCINSKKSGSRLNYFESPINYGKNISNDRFVNTNRYSPENITNLNGNNLQNWYKGSLRKLSSYLQNSQDKMDLSDIESSDNENENLISKIRKSYIKPSGTLNRQKASNKWLSFYQYLSLKEEYLPNLLLLGFLVAIIALLITYNLMAGKHSNVELDLAFNKFICSTHNMEKCIEKKELVVLKVQLAKLFDILSEHAGKSICNSVSSDKKMSFTSAKEYLNYYLQKNGKLEVSSKQWTDLLRIIVGISPHIIGIVSYDANQRLITDSRKVEHVTYLESLRPRCPLTCRVKLFMFTILGWLSYFLVISAAIGILGVVLYGANVLRRRKREAYENRMREYRDVVNTIGNILQDQLRQSETTKDEPYVPLVKIRSMIQLSHPKVRDQKYWEAVKQYMYNSEPSIELRDKISYGEVLQWRGRTSWQGSALQSDSQIEFVNAPTECLKIRNLTVKGFCPNKEQYFKRELMNRLNDVGYIKHIGFVHKENQTIAYIMCGDCNVSARAFSKINANYFNGSLLHVKFIRLDKYWDRFPDSR